MKYTKLSLILLLPAICSNASVISSIAVSIQTLPPQSIQIDPQFYVRDITLKPDSGAAAECLKPNIDVVDGDSEDSYKIIDWNQTVSRPNGKIVGYVYTGTMTNSCMQAVSGIAKLVLSRTGESATFDIPYDVPAGNSCSVDIDTKPVIPDITRGKTLAAVKFTFNALGSGSLTFKPDDHADNKGLLKDGRGNRITYSITGPSSIAVWNSIDNQWIGKLDDNYFVQLDDVPEQIPAGTYSGTMTATISCE